jgi:DnaJ domain
MRLSKAVREQLAAQYLITTLCVWDVEQRWELDRELTSAWDKARFDDPYRGVMLPKYPASRQGVVQALSTQFDTPPGQLAAHIGQGSIFADYAKPWDVAVDSLGKLTHLVNTDSYGMRIWEVAAGTLTIAEAYRGGWDATHRRTPEQQQALESLHDLESRLHPDDVAAWVVGCFAVSQPNGVFFGADLLLRKAVLGVKRYRFLRDLWSSLDLHHGEAEQEAFLAFLAVDAPYQAASRAWRRRAFGSAPRTTDAGPACFRALGLAWPCTEEDIKHAYRTLARVAHPDAGGTDEAFQRLAEAYEEALKFVAHHGEAGTDA